MAGGSTPSPSSDSKKSVDFQLNMVPFIDLLSVLIAFLLMTAVWTQIGKIDVRSQPESTGETAETPPGEPIPAVHIIIKASGYEIALDGQPRRRIDTKNDDYDIGALASALDDIVASHPISKEVVIFSEDRVPYRELIRAMDLCLAKSLENISVGGV